jgi:hypothetical protein
MANQKSTKSSNDATVGYRQAGNSFLRIKSEHSCLSSILFLTLAGSGTPIAFASALAVRPSGWAFQKLLVENFTRRILFFLILLLLNDSPRFQPHADRQPPKQNRFAIGR